MRSMRLIRDAAAVSIFATALAAGCSSDESSGTERICDPGTTQQCDGLDASGPCNGVQSCALDGLSWNECACGAGGSSGSGGTAGIGGSSGGGASGSAGSTGGSSGSSGGSAGSSGGSAGSGGTGGAAGSAGTAGSAGSFQQPGPNDDPCPTGPIFLNCSDQCAAYNPKCGEVSCPPNGADIIVNDVSELPLTVRLPASPPLDCTQCTPPVWSVTVRSYGFGAFLGLKVKVGAPWYVKQLTGSGPCYFEGASEKGCYAGSAENGIFLHFFTMEPNAPSRNAVIETLPNPVCASGEYWQ